MTLGFMFAAGAVGVGFSGLLADKIGLARVPSSKRLADPRSSSRKRFGLQAGGKAACFDPDNKPVLAFALVLPLASILNI